MRTVLKRSRWRPLCLLLFWLSLGVALLIGQPVSAINPPNANEEIRGVWLTTNDTDTLIDRPRLQSALEQLARLNFNTVYPVVWNAGYALYPSVTAERAGIQSFVRRGLQDYDILAEVTAIAHRQGMLSIPWFEFGFMAPATSELALNHPDWLTQQRDGRKTSVSDAGEVAWLNPFHPEVQQFMTNLVIELLARYDVDGIQFDDHFSLPSEFGYDPYTIALYQAETGQPAPSNYHDPSWVRWRANKITAYVQQLHSLVKARKPRAIFSVSPNPYRYAYLGHLQDWLTWVRRGLVDELIVQVYRDNLQAFREQLRQPEVQETRRQIPTGIGILTGLRNAPVSMDFIQEKIRTARAYGLGMSFFFYESLWEDSPEPAETRQSGFLALFPERSARSRPTVRPVAQTAMPETTVPSPPPAAPAVPAMPVPSGRTTHYRSGHQGTLSRVAP
ncbi:MAG: family 10 glycosylhydrolase [Leptolyngbya sp. SIO4C1]|nr:family 10 glycosylhydrolase [Leptolyngbya sp. SIO4C1]